MFLGGKEPGGKGWKGRRISPGQGRKEPLSLHGRKGRTLCKLLQGHRCSMRRNQASAHCSTHLTRHGTPRKATCYISPAVTSPHRTRHRVPLLAMPADRRAHCMPRGGARAMIKWQLQYTGAGHVQGTRELSRRKMRQPQATNLSLRQVDSAHFGTRCQLSPAPTLPSEQYSKYEERAAPLASTHHARSRQVDYRAFNYCSHGIPDACSEGNGVGRLGPSVNHQHECLQIQTLKANAQQLMACYLPYSPRLCGGAQVHAEVYTKHPCTAGPYWYWYNTTAYLLMVQPTRHTIRDNDLGWKGHRPQNCIMTRNEALPTNNRA